MASNRCIKPDDYIKLIIKQYLGSHSVIRPKVKKIDSGDVN